MNDHDTTIAILKDTIHKFMRERDWEQFHSPKNLSMAIAVEASELQEKFIWCSEQESYRILEEERDEVAAEVADIFIALLNFAHLYKLDVPTIMVHKLAELAQKYPVEKAKGKNLKYTKL